MSSYIGRFKIIKEIGRGGVGRVYRASDPKIQRDVALKVLLSGEFAEDFEIKRFHREVESCAKLRHPNIVPLYEVGQEEGRGLYMVMELIEGISLDDYMHQHRISSRHAAQLICTIARAVHYAHQEGIIHRDIKPQNILMKNNTFPMLTDFGLARQFKEDKDHLTKTGELLGTPAYMPPEQINGGIPIVQMDVYSLGTLLYELLAGRPPYEGDELQIICSILDETEPSPSSRKMNPNVPKNIDTICRKAMEKDYTRRYTSAQELAEDLERYLDGRPIKAKNAGLIEKAYRWSVRHPAKAVTVFLCLFGIALGIVLARLYEKRIRLQKIGNFMAEGERIYNRALTSEKEQLKYFREARACYEKALAIEREHPEARQKMYEMEISYGKWAMQNGYLERLRDAYDYAKATGIETPELKLLEGAIEKENEFQYFLSVLKDKKKTLSEREKALRSVVYGEDGRGLGHLIVMLDPSQGMAELAQKVLIEMPSQKKSELILKALPHITEKQAESLAQVIRSIELDLMDGILPQLKNRHFWVVKNLLIIVGILKEKRAIPYLNELTRHPRPSVQLELCHAMGAIRSPENISSLLELLESKKQPISLAAAKALERFGEKAKEDRVIQALKNKAFQESTFRAQYQAWKALIKIDPEAGTKTASKMIKAPGTSRALYQTLWDHFADQPFHELTYFLEVLDPKNRLDKSGYSLHKLSSSSKLATKLREVFRTPGVSVETQKKAVKILIEIHDEPSFHALAEGLSSNFLEVRREAAFGLSVLAQEGWKLTAIKDVMSERDIYVKMYLALAIGKTADPSHWETLVSISKDDRLEVKIATLIAVGRCKVPSTLGVIGKCLQSREPAIVQYAAWAAGEFKGKSKKILPYLEKMSEKYEKGTLFYLKRAIYKIRNS